MGKKSTTEEEAPPEHLRCSRTDGRQWRCRRRVMENLKLCEIHYLQGRHRQYKEKVPESLKLQRTKKKQKNDVVVIRAKKKKRKKEGDIQLELIRMVLEREIEKKRKKKEELHYSEGELPNGIMAIAPSSSISNLGSYSDVKASSFRYFRSKNVDRVSVPNSQVVSDGRNLKKGRRKKCHWCQRSDSWNLIKCSSCLVVEPLYHQGQKCLFTIDCWNSLKVLQVALRHIQRRRKAAWTMEGIIPPYCLSSLKAHQVAFRYIHNSQMPSRRPTQEE